MQKQLMLHLPDTLHSWPWARAINPACEEIDAESLAWVSKFIPSLSDFWQDDLQNTQIGLATALIYPTVTKEQLRIASDELYFLMVVEYATDFAPGHISRQILDILIDVCNNPQSPRPQGEIFIGQLAKEFYESAAKVATPSALKHFRESLLDFLKSCIVQGEDREKRTVRTVEALRPLRRENLGLRPTYFPIEMYLNIPDDVINHPVIKEIEYLIIDMVAIDNDIVSYNKEQSLDDDSWNTVAIAMRQYGMDVNKAMEWACNEHQKVQAEFLQLLKKVPSLNFGAGIDNDVNEYIEGITHWVRGNVACSYESRRYFRGEVERQVLLTRQVPLRPKVTGRPSFERKHSALQPYMQPEERKN